MFAYCRSNPASRIDASGTEDVCVEDVNEDKNPLNDVGGPTGTGGGGYSYTGGTTSGGGGASYTNYTGGGGNSNASSSVPQYALDTLDYITSHNGSPPKGYKGGKPYANDGRNGGEVLPHEYGPFREYDVHPKIPGQNRGLERIVTGNGAAWYTPNHYTSFIRIY